MWGSQDIEAWETRLFIRPQGEEYVQWKTSGFPWVQIWNRKAEMLQLILIVPKVLEGGKGQNIVSCRWKETDMCSEPSSQLLLPKGLRFPCPMNRPLTQCFSSRSDAQAQRAKARNPARSHLAQSTRWQGVLQPTFRTLSLTLNFWNVLTTEPSFVCLFTWENIWILLYAKPYTRFWEYIEK